MAKLRNAAERRPLRQRALVWIEQHCAAAADACGRLCGAPLASALTVAVIGIALTLPATLAVIVENTRLAARGFDAALDVSVYLKGGLPEAESRRLASRVAGRADVQTTRYVSPDEGLQEFRQWSGLGATLDVLGGNPLPGAIIVRPRATASDPAAIDRLVADLRGLSAVDQVQFDGLWVRRYSSVIDAIARVAQILGGLLAGAVLLIVGNTVRLDVAAHRNEIEILKRLGASDRFVRRPFLYGGVTYGLLGGLVSTLLVELLVVAGGGPVGRAAAAYGSLYKVAAPSGPLVLLLLGGGPLLGWLGAYATTTRQLRKIEPGGGN